jgi:hypothetical protein
MKKKLLLIALTGLYVFTMAAGFLFARTFGAKANSVPTTAPAQSNWVLIRVDDMAIETPHLVSVWLMLSSMTAEPQVYFKPIYSSDWTNAQNIALAQKFSVNPDRSFSARFLNELNRLDIPRSGLVILDNEGFKEFSALFDTPTSLQVNPGERLALRHAVLDGSESQSYQNMCATLQSENRLTAAALRWKDLKSDHFLPHPTLTPFTNLWENLVFSEFTPHCRVLDKP